MSLRDVWAAAGVGGSSDALPAGDYVTPAQSQYGGATPNTVFNKGNQLPNTQDTTHESLEKKYEGLEKRIYSQLQENKRMQENQTSLTQDMTATQKNIGKIHERLVLMATSLNLHPDGDTVRLAGSVKNEVCSLTSKIPGIAKDAHVYREGYSPVQQLIWIRETVVRLKKREKDLSTEATTTSQQKAQAEKTLAGLGKKLGVTQFGASAVVLANRVEDAADNLTSDFKNCKEETMKLHRKLASLCETVGVVNPGAKNDPFVLLDSLQETLQALLDRMHVLSSTFFLTQDMLKTEGPVQFLQRVKDEASTVMAGFLVILEMLGLHERGNKIVNLSTAVTCAVDAVKHLKETSEKRVLEHQQTATVATAEAEKLRKRVEEDAREIQKLEKQLKEANVMALKERENYNGLLALRIRQDTSSFQNLNDRVRPEVVIKKFQDVCNSERLDAADVLEKGGFGEDRELLMLLSGVMQFAWEAANEHLGGILEETKKAVAPGKPDFKLGEGLREEIRHDLKGSNEESHITHIREAVVKQYKPVHAGFAEEEGDVASFVTVCAEVAWMIVLTSPPMTLVADTDVKFDPNHHTLFSECRQREGALVTSYIWPGLKFDKNDLPEIKANVITELREKRWMDVSFDGSLPSPEANQDTRKANNTNTVGEVEGSDEEFTVKPRNDEEQKADEAAKKESQAQRQAAGTETGRGTRPGQPAGTGVDVDQSPGIAAGKGSQTLSEVSAVQDSPDGDQGPPGDGDRDGVQKQETTPEVKGSQTQSDPVVTPGHQDQTGDTDLGGNQRQHTVEEEKTLQEQIAVSPVGQNSELGQTRDVGAGDDERPKEAALKKEESPAGSKASETPGSQDAVLEQAGHTDTSDNESLETAREQKDTASLKTGGQGAHQEQPDNEVAGSDPKSSVTGRKGVITGETTVVAPHNNVLAQPEPQPEDSKNDNAGSPQPITTQPVSAMTPADAAVTTGPLDQPVGGATKSNSSNPDVSDAESEAELQTVPPGTTPGDSECFDTETQENNTSRPTRSNPVESPGGATVASGADQRVSGTGGNSSCLGAGPPKPEPKPGSGNTNGDGSDGSEEASSPGDVRSDSPDGAQNSVVNPTAGLKLLGSDESQDTETFVAEVPEETGHVVRTKGVDGAGNDQEDEDGGVTKQPGVSGVNEMEQHVDAQANASAKGSGDNIETEEGGILR